MKMNKRKMEIKNKILKKSNNNNNNTRIQNTPADSSMS